MNQNQIKKLTVVTSDELNNLFVSTEAVDSGVKAVAVKTEEGEISSLSIVSLPQFISYGGGTEEDFNNMPVSFVIRSTNYVPYMKATQAIQDSMFSGKRNAATLSRGADFKPPEGVRVAEIHANAVAENIIVSIRGIIYKGMELRPQSGELVQFLKDQPNWREMILAFAGNPENFSQPTDAYVAKQIS